MMMITVHKCNENICTVLNKIPLRYGKSNGIMIDISVDGVMRW